MRFIRSCCVFFNLDSVWHLKSVSLSGVKYSYVTILVSHILSVERYLLFMFNYVLSLTILLYLTAIWLCIFLIE